jgi:DNA processing protein
MPYEKPYQHYYLAAVHHPLIARAYFQYLKHQGDCTLPAFFNELTAQSSDGSARQEKLLAQIKAVNWPYIDDLLKRLTQRGIWLCCLEDDNYPLRLKHINAPPLVFFAQGNAALLQQECFAIIGSRKPSPAAKAQAVRFAQGLAGDFVIVSGMALGVDGIAHRASLDVAEKTIAVMGSGFDYVYPRRHYALYQDILQQQGLVITEYLPDTPPLASYFPQRNRIISGLSHGVLVVEAALKSGSLITARLAAEQGRDVFVLPCSANHLGGQGGLRLIQEGAKLVMAVDDVLAEYPQRVALMTSKRRDVKQSQVGKEGLLLLDHLCEYAVSAEVLAHKSGLAFDKVCSILLRLELLDKVERVTAGYVKSE